MYRVRGSLDGTIFILSLPLSLTYFALSAVFGSTMRVWDTLQEMH